MLYFICKAKEVSQMGKRVKQKGLTLEKAVELIIQSIVAIATLINALKA